ncbi:hypothetical protein [Saccharothrix deserti]|nr:hypothetical protein [Saccharothrix deserti]
MRRVEEDGGRCSIRTRYPELPDLWCEDGLVGPVGYRAARAGSLPVVV